jgi:serine/threonine protein kinase
MPEVGSALGRYHIIDQLGAGGMGAVYRARDTVLEREVAIKVIAKSVEPEDLLNRFHAEARAAARLQHPNILGVFDFAEHDGTAFIVMPFVRGQTLASVLARTGELIPLQTTKAILEQVASALDFAHSQGIIHRDIKPANIMIEAGTNSAILMDFGIALIRGSENSRLTRPGLLIGTARYIAPEQILGRDAGERSDQYSVGLIAFEMLTGRLPFSGNADFEVMTAHVANSPPQVTDFRPDLPAATAAAIARALAKNPAERFSSVGEFVQAAFRALLLVSEMPSHAGVPATKSQSPAPREPATAGRAAFSWFRSVLGLLRGAAERKPAPKPTESAGALVHEAAAPPSPSHTPNSNPAGQFTSDATVVAPVIVEPGSRGPTGPFPVSSQAGDATRLFHVPAEGQHDAAGSERVVEERPRVGLVFRSCAEPLRIGKTIELLTMPFRIGRSDADLSIPGDPGLSRHHAEIDWVNGVYVLRDLNRAS